MTGKLRITSVVVVVVQFFLAAETDGSHRAFYDPYAWYRSTISETGTNARPREAPLNRREAPVRYPGDSSEDALSYRIGSVPDEGSDFANPEASRPIRQQDKKMLGQNCSFGLCEAVPDYPEDVIKRLLDNTRVFDAFFGTPTPDLSTKSISAENVCATKPTVFYPRMAVNTEQKSRLIVNVGKYKQGISAEMCSETERTCNFSDLWPASYVSVCEQRFSQRLLLALDDDHNEVVETFQAPSCCVCMYKNA